MLEKLTIVIPVYNEEEPLPMLHKVLLDYLRFTPMPSKILFVDDGSTDKSLSIIQKICTDSRFSYRSLETNCGLSTALKAGIDSSLSEYVGYTDADLQTSPKAFMSFLEFLPEYDMVTGVRTRRHDTLVKVISSKIANSFRRTVINDGIQDTCCPLKIMKTNQAQALPFFKGMHRFLPALIQLNGGKVKEVPVRHFPRCAGKAKYHLFNRLVGPFFDTLAFVWMKRRHINYQFKLLEQGSSTLQKPVIGE